MNLTQALKELIVDRFKTGESIQNISLWYKQEPSKIEGVLRKELVFLADSYNALLRVSEIAMADESGEAKGDPDYEIR